MLEGPLMPDPEKRGGQRRAYLYTFLDDHSRMCLHGRSGATSRRWSSSSDGRSRSTARPARVYYDNGAVYRSRHMRHIVACLSIVFTKAHRPMGHGKIEAFNRLVTSAFLAEVPAARITTLDALNEARLAWADGVYNVRVHSGTGERPRDRWTPLSRGRALRGRNQAP